MLTDQAESFVWPTEFACTLITENLLIPNHYSIRIGVEPGTPKPQNIALGFKKIKYFVTHYLQNSILICNENPLKKSLKSIGSNFVLLPFEPYDYFVAAVLYSKFLAIAEKYFEITYITVDSRIGDRVQYTIRHPNECGIDLNGNHWWNMDSVNTGKNITTTWEDLNFKDETKFEPRIIKGGLSEN